ncbi:MAG: hypothetical protein ACRDTZ_10135 [Pseudonocardiaceae bacterium]
MHTHSDGLLLRDYLRSTPLSAARHGLYTWLPRAAPEPYLARLHSATEALRDTLGVSDLQDVGAALATRKGKPPRAVMHALTAPELTGLLAEIADHWGHWDLAPCATAWTAVVPSELALSGPAHEGAHARRELAGALLTRAEVLRSHLPGHGGLRPAHAPVIDGRTLAAAAAAWQSPLITGSVPRVMPSGAARHANRVGRVSAAVGLSRFSVALRAEVPDSWVVDPVLLLAAVVEAITPVGPEEEVRALRGALPLRVPRGDPSEGSLFPDRLWPVLDMWGAPKRRMKGVLALAWKLSPVESDVVLWALAVASIRLAVTARYAAGNMAPRGAADTSVWEAFRDREAPAWESAAGNAWALLQSARPEHARTSWPGAVFADPGDESSWPWPEVPDPWGAVPELSGMVSEVPNVEVGE